MTARFAHGLVAAGLAALAASAAPARAGDVYELDPAHSQAAFSVARFGFNDVIAFFPGVTGVVTLDETAPEKSAVEAKIAVAGLQSGDATRNEHLLGPRWFNAAAFPAMTFASTAVERTGEKTARVTGDLTILGETRSVVLDVTLNKLGADPATKRPAAGFSATASLRRADFGMTTAPALIGADVAVRIEALGHKVGE